MLSKVADVGSEDEGSERGTVNLDLNCGIVDKAYDEMSIRIPEWGGSTDYISDFCVKGDYRL